MDPGIILCSKTDNSMSCLSERIPNQQYEAVSSGQCKVKIDSVKTTKDTHKRTHFLNMKFYTTVSIKDSCMYLFIFTI